MVPGGTWGGGSRFPGSAAQSLAWTRPAGHPLPNGFMALPVPTPQAQNGTPHRVTTFIAAYTSRWLCSLRNHVSSVDRRFQVQRGVGSWGRATTETPLGLALEPVRTRFCAGAGGGAMAAIAQSCGRADLAVAPSQGLATVSVFGPHVAPGVSEGFDRVGLETDTRAAVTS